MNQIKLEDKLLWGFIAIIFSCGILYASVIKIPEIERAQRRIEIKISVVEANYANIKESLYRIEKKINRDEGGER